MIRRWVGTLRAPSPRRLRPVRRRWPLLLPLVAAVAWAVPRLLDDPAPTAALAASSTTMPAPTSTLLSFEAPVGSRTTGARCWMVVIDESSSMSSSDQAGTRADAVRAAADFLAGYGLVDDRIGVTWFADRSDVTPPANASGGVAPRVDTQALGSGTKISSALGETLVAMDRDCGTAQRVIVLVSDGQATGDAELQAIAALLGGADTDVNVHLIAMNGGGAFEPARTFWQDPALGVDSIQTVSSFGSDEVAGAVAAILTIETGQQIEAR